MGASRPIPSVSGFRSISLRFAPMSDDERLTRSAASGGLRVLGWRLSPERNLEETTINSKRRMQLAKIPPDKPGFPTHWYNVVADCRGALPPAYRG
jgi:hypothetical protein